MSRASGRNYFFPILLWNPPTFPCFLPYFSGLPVPTFSLLFARKPVEPLYRIPFVPITNVYHTSQYSLSHYRSNVTQDCFHIVTVTYSNTLQLFNITHLPQGEVVTVSQTVTELYFTITNGLLPSYGISTQLWIVSKYFGWYISYLAVYHAINWDNIGKFWYKI